MIELSNFISALVGGVVVSLVNVHFSYKKERNLLVEKWINKLRDEVAVFLGKCEQLRMHGKGDKKPGFSDPIYEQIIHSMYKIEMLLDGNDEKQKYLISSVEGLRRLADINDFPRFEADEQKVVRTTSLIINEHWKRINSDFKGIISN